MTLDQMIAKLQQLKAERPHWANQEVSLAEDSPNSTTCVTDAYFASDKTIALRTRTEYGDL